MGWGEHDIRISVPFMRDTTRARARKYGKDAGLWLFLRVRPNYIHSASNYIHTDGPTATARARG